MERSVEHKVSHLMEEMTMNDRSSMDTESGKTYVGLMNAFRARRRLQRGFSATVGDEQTSDRSDNCIEHSSSSSNEQMLSKNEDSSMKNDVSGCSNIGNIHHDPTTAVLFFSSSGEWNNKLNPKELEEVQFIDGIFSESENQHFPIDAYDPSKPMRSVVACVARFGNKIPAFYETSVNGQYELLESSIFQVPFIQNTTKCSKITTNQEFGFWIEHSAVAEESNPSCFNVFKPEFSCDKRAGNIILLIALFSLEDESSVDENDRQIITEYKHLLMSLLRSYLMTIHGNHAHQIMDSLPSSFEKINEFAESLKYYSRRCLFTSAKLSNDDSL